MGQKFDIGKPVCDFGTGVTKTDFQQSAGKTADKIVELFHRMTWNLGGQNFTMTTKRTMRLYNYNSNYISLIPLILLQYVCFNNEDVENFIALARFSN